MASKDEIIAVAKQCFDPEIPVNIWDLGLIYDIDVDDAGENVKIRMTLTTQHCPAAQEIPADLKKKIQAAHSAIKNVDVDLVFDPPWTPERISEEGKKVLGIEEGL